MRRRVSASIVVAGAVVAAAASGATAQPPVYTLRATQSCLTSLGNAVSGLPPATPPTQPLLFVDALPRNDLISGFSRHSRRQLGVWTGKRTYDGIILSFFARVADARLSSKSLASLSGGMRVRNVDITWAERAKPSGSMRRTVLGCLRSTAPVAAKRPVPAASLGTFAGRWGGHDRGLSITAGGQGREFADGSCCERVYQMGFRIVSVSGTLTRATAVYRVASFKRFEGGVTRSRVGEVGKLLLRNGILTNDLTHDFFCSDPAWGATGVCGA